MTSQADIEAEEEPNWDGWIPVGHYQDLREAYDHALVILAMGEACRVAPTEQAGAYELQAEARAAAGIADELRAYQQETLLPVARPQVHAEWAKYPAGWTLTGIWLLVLVAVFYWQNQDASLADRAASSSVGLIAHGEWWRPFTALFLHADFGHLAGNLLGGLVFATLVARCVGPLRGWLMILACGTMGNVLTSRLTYPEPFVSLGASTAVFAALGILSGFGLVETLRFRARMPWLRIAAPVVAGIILLGWLGGGHDPRTDVLGHVLGYSSGLVAGVAVGVIEEKRAGGKIAAEVAML